MGLPIIYNQLSYFVIVSDNITVMLIKTIDCYDLTKENLSYIQFIFENMMAVLQKYGKSEGQAKNQPNQSVGVMARFLFFKVLKVTSIVNFI